MLRIGIVGAGLRGRLFADALADRPGVEVVGFAEPSTRVAEDAATTGLPVVPTHVDLLSDLAPDAVIVATPDFAHREVAVDVAKHGLHLLIEKPLATTLDDANAIAAAVASGGGQCLVGFENRWNPHVLKAYESIQAGELGVPITSNATLSNSYFVPTQMLSWAAQSSPAWFLMPHTIDMLTWLTGRTPTRVSAVGSRGILEQRGVDTWDVIRALLTFDDGTTASLSSAWVLPDAGEGIVDFRFGVIGTEGSLSADLSHQGLTTVTDRQRSLWPLSGRIGRSAVGPAVWMVQDFAAALIDGTDLGPGIDQGLLVTRTICAIEDSLRTSAPISL
ncbi:Gfo/Idh/MocA family oxidoreductase [Kribbella sp. NPDC051952]|uniref:Gfo/Idh/MocA family protein n=1 Tax=Kribbella sp. NPDC051952 TaxID=3154851 RepID=UPI00341D0E7A